jgi:hypothetical protein
MEEVPVARLPERLEREIGGGVACPDEVVGIQLQQMPHDGECGDARGQQTSPRRIQEDGKAIDFQVRPLSAAFRMPRLEWGIQIQFAPRFEWRRGSPPLVEWMAELAARSA